MKGSSLKKLKPKFWLMRVLNSRFQWIGENWPSSSRLSGRELIFQNLVHRQLDRIGFEQAMYPVRCAAGYSYLYLIIRALEELPVQRILELGAGESTRLIDHLLAGKDAQAITLEHDHYWAGKLQASVSQTVLHSDLVERGVFGRSTLGYGADALAGQAPFDMLLIDGPPGSRQRSRWAALEYIDACLSRDFIIVFDDAERRGELQTIQAALQLIESKGWSYQARLIQSLNSQFLIAGGKFRTAFYF